jgi:NitT/TauT family transport system substrate-binding protein
MKTKLTPFAKLLIVVVIIGSLGFLFYKFKDQILPGKNGSSTPVNTEGKKVYKIGVVTWGGYAGGQYFNEGFSPNENSRFYKDYGFMVDFKILDDPTASRSAWKSGDVDLLWGTVDAFPTEVNGLKEFNPQIIMQADWSRGGDAVVVRRGINAVNDLKGKKIAFAEMSPSHSFLLWLLEAGNMEFKDIQPVKVASAVDAADLFKKGQVDAAVVWSPDDADCINKVTGSKILQSTKQASYIIADVFIVKKDFLDAHKEDLKKLVEGWFKGAAEINSSEDAKKKAAKILVEGLKQPEDYCLQAINNVRLCTYGDNVNFYNLNGNYKGVTGEAIWMKMEEKYKKAGYITESVPSWRMVGNPVLISSISLSGSANEPEKSATFTAATDEVKKADAVSKKGAPISFRSGEFTLDDNAKYIIDKEFVDLAKSFGNARIRIEGNTDNVGNYQANKDLSFKRAKAVADYMVKEHNFDVNRFIVLGNGPDKAVADNNTEDGRAKNRRTDFEILAQ